jgi:hypothetical protein
MLVTSCGNRAPSYLHVDCWEKRIQQREKERTECCELVYYVVVAHSLAPRPSILCNKIVISIMLELYV